MTKFILFISLFSTTTFFLVGCKKKYSVQGRVYNVVTGEGVANSSITFSRNVKDNSGEGKDQNYLTDGQGYFNVATKANNHKIHKVIFNDFKDVNMFLLDPYERTILGRERSHDIDFRFARYEQYEIFFVDSTYKNEFPETHLSIELKHKSVDGFYINDTISVRPKLFGQGELTQYQLLEGWTYFKLHSTRSNGLKLLFEDSIYVSISEGVKTLYYAY